MEAAWAEGWEAGLWVVAAHWAAVAAWAAASAAVPARAEQVWEADL